MQETKSGIFKLLSLHGMNYQDINFTETVNVLLEEMEQGLAGNNSSLAMIPTYIEAGHPLPVGKTTLVMDAGGTNLRVSTVSFDSDGKPQIGYFKKYAMPGKDNEVNFQEFYSLLAGYLTDIAGESDKMGFCFSYPMTKTSDKDGVPTLFSKQIKAPEVVGKPVGASLKAMLEQKGIPFTGTPVLLNDTVATLLTGMSASLHRQFSTYIGFILGTGTNTGYVEANENIKKLPGLKPGESMIINMESGGFAHPPTGDWDKAFDATNQDPGHYVFEKMISGAYFGKLSAMSLKCAAEENYFSPVINQVFTGMKELFATPVADGFLHNPHNQENLLVKMLSAGTEDDRRKVYYIIDALMERSAMMTAVNLSSAVIKTGKGHDPLSPVCITVDGTTFYLNKDFPNRVQRYLRTFLVEEKGLYFEIIKVEDAPLVGAAIAGLTN